MDRERLTRKIFDYNISKCRNNWSHELKQIFSKVGMVELFHNNFECDIRLLKCKIKQIYWENWETTRYNKPKLRYYNIYKMSCSLEKYVTCNLPRIHGSLLAQFRAGILPINVEIGRF